MHWGRRSDVVRVGRRGGAAAAVAAAAAGGAAAVVVGVNRIPSALPLAVTVGGGHFRIKIGVRMHNIILCQIVFLSSDCW